MVRFHGSPAGKNYAAGAPRLALFGVATLWLGGMTLLAALVTAWPLPAWAAAETPGVAVALEQGKTQAASFLAQGRAEEAYRVYSRLLREEPEDDEVNLGLARAALVTDRLPQALMSLERLVDRHPSDTALRLELIRLYARAGDEKGARREMDALRRYAPALDEAEAGRMLEDLHRRIAAQDSRWRFAGKVAAGVMYDSNVNSGLFGRYLNLGGLNLIMNDAMTRKSAWGEYANAAINGAWRSGKKSPWWVVGDVAAYAKTYNRAVPANQSFGWGRMALGLRRLGTSSLLDVRFKVEHALYDPYRTVTLFGPELTFAHSLSPHAQLISSARVEHRDYTRNYDQDGTYWSVGQSVRLLFGHSAGGGHEFVAGVRWLGGDAKTAAWDYQGWEASARLLLRPLSRLDVSPFALWRQEYYRGTATLLERVLGAPARRNSVFQTGVFFVWRWSEHWSQEAGYQYVNSMSNSPFYKYDEHVFNMGVAWSF